MTIITAGQHMPGARFAFPILSLLLVITWSSGFVGIRFASAEAPVFLVLFWRTLAAGLILGYGYLATERLWLPIGFHFSWNFALGPIFGFPVSGIDLPAWLMHNPSGPVVWTGGAFGPEAGVLGIIAMALGWLGIRYFRRLWYRPGQAALETGAESPDNKMQDESRVA